MLNENIKTLRKKKGYSQEMVAEKLNVVRQTVSKWEKGYSVPDAEMLERLAELFEVSVGELLGKPEAEPEQSAELGEVVQQLVLLNDHLARQSRARKRIWKVIGIVAACFAAVILLWFVAFAAFSVVTDTDSEERITYEICCTLGDEEYLYSIVCDEQYRILEAGGDAWIADHVQTEKYGDANILLAQIERYFADRGGTCEIAQIVSGK